MGKIYFITDASGVITEFSLGVIILTMVIALALPITFYLLRSIAIYKLAKNHGVDKAFLAWIPFAWIYPLCMLVKEFLFFGTPYGKIATVICVIFCVYGGLSVICEAIVYFPLVRYFLTGGDIFFAIDQTYVSGIAGIEQFWSGNGIYVVNIQNYGNAHTVARIINKIYQIMNLLDLVRLVVLINIYIAIFRKLWPQHYIIAAVTSAFGLFPIMIFICRNKVAMSFEQYINSMKNQYNENSNPSHSSKKDEPFEEFKSKDDDNPFSDF